MVMARNPQRRIASYFEEKTGGRIYRWLAWFALASCAALACGLS
jgi:hypothetical protein